MKALLPFSLNYDHQDILTIKRKSVKENKDNKNPLKKHLCTHFQNLLIKISKTLKLSEIE